MEKNRSEVKLIKVYELMMREPRRVFIKQDLRVKLGINSSYAKYIFEVLRRLGLIEAVDTVYSIKENYRRKTKGYRIKSK